MKSFLPAFAVLLAALPCVAVQTQKFTQDSFDDFAEGEARGVAVASDGFLRLGVEATRLAALPVQTVWAVADAPDGTLYVAAGNEGQVFRVGRNGQPEEIFKAKELQAQALALDRRGVLFVATLPDGRIYRVEGPGKSSVFFEPKEKYIWALAFDAAGNLFAATGDKGKIFKITPSGKGGVFYDSDETHLRCLLFDAKKRLWVGSDGNGIVYRFDSTAGAAAIPFAAWDSDFREITALAAASDGAVFAAAMGDGKGGRPPPLARPPASKAAASGAGGSVGAQALEAAMKGDGGGSDGGADKSGAGEIVRIAPDGSVERWWGDSEDVYSLAVPGPGRVWAGTGRKGKLLEVIGPHVWTILNQLEAETLTTLLPRGERWIAATSNDGALWSLSGATGRKGFFESKILDARASARWGAVEWRAAAGAAQLLTRSGNTAKPDKVWSGWKTLDAANRIQSPVGRYLQYRIEMKAEKDGAEPAVDRVDLFYQPKNQPPKIARVIVTPDNIELVRAPRPEMPLPPIAAGGAVGAPAAGTNAKGAAATSANTAVEALLAAARAPLLQQFRKMGWRSVTWQAGDPDNDDLVAQVWSRASGAEKWTLLCGDLRENFFAWDAARWPDGDYVLKVVVSDLSGNLPAELLSDEMVSEVFTVDHTAPAILPDLSPEALKKGTLSLVIRDTTSVVDEAEYSVDGADWRPLLPVGGIYDVKENRFVIPISDLVPGDHYVNVRASDSADNIASATIRFKK
ncbi:MAG: hypothetical protein IT578_04530 [Verrucomicrobiae bacterium]|nr:hypothetical protein [Verrucomicrobiae bacterium]